MIPMVHKTKKYLVTRWLTGEMRYVKQFNADNKKEAISKAKKDKTTWEEDPEGFTTNESVYWYDAEEQ